MKRFMQIISISLVLIFAGGAVAGDGPVVLGDDGRNHKYPSVAVSDLGEVWVAYSVFERGINDEIEVMRSEARGFSEAVALSSNQEPDDDPQLVVDGSGRVWVFWAGRRNGDWEILCRRHENGAWSEEENLTRYQGLDWNLAAAAKGDEVWLTWERNQRGPQNDVMAMRYRYGRWEEPIQVSATSDHEGRPAISIGPDNQVWIAYESFRNMNSDIFLKPIKQGKPLQEIRAASHAAYDFEPAVLADRKGRVWVAFVSTRIGDIYSLGTVNVYTKVLDSGKWMRPVIKPDSTPGLVSDMNRQTEPTPLDSGQDAQLAEDADGRIWVLWHNRLNKNATGFFNWNIYARHFTEQGASQPLDFKSKFRSEFKVKSTSGLLSAWAFLYTRLQGEFGATDRHPAVYPDPSGGLALAWDCSPPFGKGRVCVSEVKSREAVSDPLLVEDIEPESSLPAWHRTFERPRSIDYHGRPYQLVFGDLHAHTNISDAVGNVEHIYLTQRYYYKLDFGACTDHAESNDMTGSEWARVQAYADLFNDPAGGFLAFPGYEWTMIREAGGHHTAVFPQGNISEIVHLTSPEGDEKDEFAKSVARFHGIIGVHTQTSNIMGFNYDVKHDYENEKMIEVISHHGIGEYPGNPYELGGANGLTKGCHLQDILEKGYRYGVVGSTDSHYPYDRIHLGTPHDVYLTGYMGVYVTEFTREGVFDALMNRRVFAVSGQRFLIDFRVNGHLMGEEFRIKPDQGLVWITATVESLSPIERVELIKNAKTIKTWQGAGTRMSVETVDRPDQTREWNYYYLRVTTQDNNFAWSSPVWLDR